MGEFERSVEYGLSLSKRIYYGKHIMSPSVQTMSKSGHDHHQPPSTISSKASNISSKDFDIHCNNHYSSSSNYLPEAAVMVYAVVSEPEAVDNPDVPSYQPYVHGRCDPPALIPLHMYHQFAMEIETSLLDQFASVSAHGTWRVHCIKPTRKCDCRIAVSMGEQDSLLGVEIDVPGRSYHSQLIAEGDANDKDKTSIGGLGYFLKDNIYTFRIPQVEGGSILSIKARWSQKLVYNEGQFCLKVPFTFPSYVNPIGKHVSRREKILLNVNSGIGKEILCKSTSHALKEVRREVGKMSFLYHAEVRNWSTVDFNFSYSVNVDDLFGGVLLQYPLLRDSDDRQMFCFYLFPGIKHSRKVFRREVIFLIDISRSMKGNPLENTKNAVTSSLSKLNPEDSFNIIGFNSQTYMFSSLMEPATQEAMLRATHWLNDKLTADGGTNILLPLKQAMKLLEESSDSIPLVFLITDGAVEDERDICNFIKSSLKSKGSFSPRICTFGIGRFCNHHFLQTLAQIGRGHFDSAYDADSVDYPMQRLFATASSVILANIKVDAFEHLDSLELLPCSIPDLTYGSPLIVSGRYNGNFPDSVKVSGRLADTSEFTLELKAQKEKDLQLDRVLGRRQIDLLTANAWFAKSKDLEQKVCYQTCLDLIKNLLSLKKVAQISLQAGIPSEYTQMILIHTETAEKAPEKIPMQDVINKFNPLNKTDSGSTKSILLGSLGVGFGNLIATADSIPPGTVERKPSSDATEMLVKAASNCCGSFLDRCCCMCFIRTCSHVNNQSFILFSQICAALACFECINCCFELCG